MMMLAQSRNGMRNVYAVRENGYRFAFNGQEKTDEISGSGNHNTALYWEYDTRLGRRWNLDPKPNPSISNYATLANNPMFFSDPLGDTTRIYDKKGNALNTIYDGLDNQTHFMSRRDYNNIRKNHLIKDKDGNHKIKNLDVYAKDLRSNSFAYFDSKVESQLRTFFDSSPEEVAFGLAFENGKSGRLIGVMCKTCPVFERTIIPDNVVNENSGLNFFAIGHSHPGNYKHAPRPSPFSFILPSNTIVNPVDYRTVIGGVTHHPLMILSNKGITIYQSLNIGDLYYSNPSVTLWNNKKHINYMDAIQK